MRDHKPISIENLLSNVPLFDALAPEEIALIAKSTREIHAEKGEILFHKGDACNGFHILVYGQVKLAFTSAQGNEKVVELIHQGQCFGEAIMFMEKPYIVFAQTLSDALLLHVHVRAEPRHVANAEREVDLEVLLESQLLRVVHHRVAERLGVDRRQRLDL